MEVKVRVESKEAGPNLLRSLHAQYRLGHLCDVTVRAGRGSFPAHRAVLAASSAFFRKAFIGGGGTAAALLLRDVRSEDFAAFAEFAYTASVAVPRAQLPRLHRVAVRLQCSDLEEACRVTAVTAETPPDPTDQSCGGVAPPPAGRVPDLNPGKRETVESSSGVVPPRQASGSQSAASQASGGQSVASQVSGGQSEASQASGGQSAASLASGGQSSASQASGGQSAASLASGGQSAASQASGGQSSASQASGGQSAASRDGAGTAASVALATKVVIMRMRRPETEGGAREPEEALRCEECAGAEFGSLRLLQAHARRAHGARLQVKYACDLCPRLVATRQNLRQHRAAVHASERAFACPACAKRFKRPKDVSDHARRVHGRKRPQQCPRCSKLLASKAGLALHLRTHTGERPYGCAHCGATFAQKSSYNTHTRNIHQGAKGGKCSGPANRRRCGSRTDPGSAGGEETPAVGEGGGLGRGGRNVPADKEDDVRAEEGGAEGEEPGTVVHAGKGTMGEEAGQDHHGDKEEEEPEREEEEEEGTESDNKDGVCIASAGEAETRLREESQGGAAEAGRGAGRGSAGTCSPEGSGGVLQCDRCGGRFPARGGALARHCRQAHGAGPRYRCETCGRGLGSAGAWREHRDCVHSDERRFACRACGRTFKRQRDVRTHHARTHERRRTRPLCSVCGRMLSSHSALLFHMRTHSGERPYHCSLCNQRFSQPSQLKTHTRGHTGERPYICEVCGASFTDSGKLTTHQRTHTGQRSFQCDVCQKSFASKEYLKRHKLCHLGARPFQCEQCGKSFGLRSSYFQHCRVHSDTRPFFCELCGKSFTQQGALRRHQRIHTGEKPFQCKACERSFTDMSTLRRHVAVHDKKAEWRTYVIDLTNKKEHNWSKIKVLGNGHDDGCHGGVSSLTTPITQGPGQKNDQSQLQR